MRVTCNPAAHTAYLGSLQRLRAKVYLEDGAIQPWQIDSEGRHHSDIDRQSWHLLLVDESEVCVGCARYLVHPYNIQFDDLQVRTSALSLCPEWGSKMRAAIEKELTRARRHELSFAELGGWAIAPEYRHTKAALEILLGSYAWAAVVGHCLCITTATRRNQSAPILRRIGGRSLIWEGQELPTYFDPQYGCAMELLRFDSREPPKRFSPLLREMVSKLQCAAVIFGQSSTVPACCTSICGAAEPAILSA